MNAYNFTDRVRKVLQLARDEAAGLHHEVVSSEHLLLGILRDGEGVAAEALLNLDISLDGLTTMIYRMVKIGRSRARIGDVPYSPAAKQVFEWAMAEARELKHSHVGTDHLLLGLLREGEGIGAQALTKAGATLETTREQVLLLLGEDPRLLSNA